MDELLTRKAIAEILHGMQSETNKAFEERKINPLGKPNKNFLGRTIHSMMNHNKRELQKTRKNCQEKLRELNDFCNNRDKLTGKRISSRGTGRRDKDDSSSRERSHSDRHPGKMKRKRKKTRRSESSDSSDDYSNSKKEYSEQFQIDDEEYEEDTTTYNMDPYNGYAIVPIPHYPMLPYFASQHNETPKTEDDIDKEIMRDLRSSSSDQNSDSNHDDNDNADNSSDGEILTINVSSSSASSLSSDSENSVLDKTSVINCNSSSTDSDSVVMPRKIRRKPRNSRPRRKNESIQCNTNTNSKNVESDIIELISDNSCDVNNIPSTGCSSAAAELPSTDATINTNINVPAGNTSDFVDLTED